MAPVDFRAVRAKALMRESTTTTTTSTRVDTLSFAARGGFVDTDVDDEISSSSSPDVAKRVPGLAYCREFIGARDAEFVESALLREPAAWWTKGRGRRVMNAGGTSPSRLYREGDDEAIPTYLRELVEVLVRRKASERAANHVLVNEYDADGFISPHSDGDVYAPDVQILTLRSSALIEFWPAEGATAGDFDECDNIDAPRPVVSVLLEPRSLLMYRGEAYRLRHGIRARVKDVVAAETANARELGLEIGDVVERNPAGRLSVVFVRKYAERRCE